MKSRLPPLLVFLALLQSAVIVGLLMKEQSHQITNAPAVLEIKVSEEHVMELDINDNPMPTDIPESEYSRPIG